MTGLLQTIKKFIENKKRVNYRDRRAHYASSGLKCLRDQYWERTGEPVTNKTDSLGMMRMMVGDAVEREFVKSVLSQLHWFGYHPVSDQIAIGMSNPNVDGYLDYMLAVRDGDKFNPFVLEIKTKSGYGADLFMNNFEPSQDYMSQLGIYLKDLSSKGITNEGIFLYILLSDKNFGQIVQLNCSYDAETDLITCHSGESSTGIKRSLDYTYRVGKSIERFEKLDEHLAAKTIPEPDYKYKHDLTPEYLESLSDHKMRSMIKGDSIGGDWQPLYSRYKNKQLETDGMPAERTEEEIGILRAEYRRRHPKSKL